MKEAVAAELAASYDSAVVDEMRADGSRIGSVSICSFRPFPLTVLREALQAAKRVVVLEKCLAVGLGGIVSDGVRKSLSGIALNGYTVIAGLGGCTVFFVLGPPLTRGSRCQA